MIELQGYSITEKIYDSNRTVVYRGQRQSDAKTAIVKVLRNEYPSFSELLAFRNQYTITKNLNIPGIVQPIALETYRNGYALVMEDVGGISLSDYIKHKKKKTKEQGNTSELLSSEEFLAIALQLADIFDGLYRDRVIHKDIKPANILIKPETFEIGLIDFSIASLLPRETQILQNPNVLEGTLAYISPEQTGRMNRGIDYRTDFYSLGITFYELLAGKLPFESDDPMELVHCHIAKEPPSLREVKGQNSQVKNEEIPQVLVDIVMKLMAKNAEDRYQSALGLKHDLETCLERWQVTGNIANFELATRDICDCFTIPEKLYGREADVQTLLNAFQRVANPPQGQRGVELMLVTGFSGIGKTAIVNEVHKPIIRQRGYFIKGKFDQLQRNIPFSAFVQAFRDLMGQLLAESPSQVEQWRSQILAAVGKNGQVILDVIPEVEWLIGKQPIVPELEPSGVQNRFQRVFGNFIQVFPSVQHPLVMFLDDLQWVDRASLQLIQQLMSQTEIGHLLLIGAYRDNEVSFVHPLMLALDEIRSSGSAIETIALEPLTQTDLNHLIADTLSCASEAATPLTQLVFNKTTGNPFFSTQFLKALHEQELIVFNFQVGSWQCNIDSVRSLSLSDDVVEFMAEQLQNLPVSTQTALKLAACIGNQFDLETLAIIHEKSLTETAADLWVALQEGSIVPQNEIYKLFQEELEITHPEAIAKNKAHQIVTYKFLHDRVQQAAYSLIPEHQKQLTHLKIGRLLWQNTSPDQQQEQIFAIVSQLNYGIDLITESSERQQLAQLNLKAGVKAKEATAYSAALYYLNCGIKLLTTNSWKTAANLTRNLYEEAAESAFLNADFEQMESLSQEVLQHTSNLLDRVKVYEIKLQAHQVQGQQLQAIETGREILQQLAIALPESATPADIQRSVENTLLALAGRKIEDLVNLPLMKDPLALVALRIMASLVPSAHQSSPSLFPILACEEVNLSLKYGNAPLSAPGYADFSILLNKFNQLEAGCQFGQLALIIGKQFQLKFIQSMTGFKVATFNLYNYKAVQKSITLLQDSYRFGLDAGDLVHLFPSIFFKLFYGYLSGAEVLEKLRKEIAVCESNFATSTNTLHWSNIVHQAIANLTEKSENPEYLTGKYCNEEQLLSALIKKNDMLSLHIFYLNKLILGYLFNPLAAINIADWGEKYLQGGGGLLSVPVFLFYDSLSRLVVYPTTEPSTQSQLLLKVDKNLENLKFRAKFAPMNFQHKYDLVEAEKYRVLGNKIEAIEYYDRAIHGAQENKYFQEQALAYELAAKFYLDWGKTLIAQTYMEQAYRAYQYWGTTAKLNHLEQSYPQLLSNILQRSQVSLEQHEAINSGSISALSTIDTTISSTTTSKTHISGSPFSAALDLTTILKASQILAREIELDQLLSTLMQTIIENAGAESGILILEQQGNWVIQAQAIPNKSQGILEVNCLQSIPIDTCENIPASVIHYVSRTGETLVIKNATVETNFAGDRYIIQQQPKSILCMPIHHQGQLIGILYLENNLATAAFTRDRLDAIKLLIAQVAISLNNALLYQNLAVANEKLENYSHNLEEKVTERTQELSRKNQHLQQALGQLQHTQSQLLQTEKMSSLGQMVAGIAHEINNPIGFIYSNLTHVKQSVQNLLELVTVYQQNYPNPAIEVREKIAEIDLEFLVEDLDKILGSMRLGSDRIRQIVLGLRNFSRLDESEMKPVDIHEGIENTLMILQHRLTAKNDRPEIQVIKNYAPLPLITCYASQMNQVFLNILNNAIDAVEESFAILPSSSVTDKGQIAIRTQVLNSNRILISFADTGVGMTELVCQHIFDPFFTTKPVGKGTGLGLSISYQIIIDKHKGDITCHSILGEGTEFAIAIPIHP